MGKKITILLLAVLLMLSLPVYAEETGSTAPTEPEDYAGPLDPITGLPPSEQVLPENGDEVVLSKGVYGYDRKAGHYVNYVEKITFFSNYPRDAVIPYGEVMSITLPGGLTSVLYRNGTEVVDPDLTRLEQAGSYVLEVFAGGNGSTSFCFRILESLTNSISEITLPSGFSFDYITLNGEEYSTEYSNYAAFLEDGAYEVRWACQTIGKQYTLTFRRDTQPPELTLADVVGGNAYGPVAITGVEADGYIVVTDEDGSATTYRSSTTLSKAGKYKISVYDAAGNSNAYELTIHFYLNMSAGVAIMLVLAAILGLYLYGRYIRKHPRVG